jgi:hypothetical protein
MDIVAGMRSLMLVTAVQPVGARGLGTVQAGVTRAQFASPAAHADTVAAAESRPAVPDAPQPVLFLRGHANVDTRPESLRLRHAVERYRSDGTARRRSRRGATRS